MISRGEGERKGKDTEQIESKLEEQKGRESEVEKKCCSDLSNA
jgi:hypothetical protein